MPPLAFGSWKVWFLAARPATLTASVAPVLVGTAAGASQGSLAPLPFLAALFAAVLIQVGTNFANDVFDFERGADALGRLGPPRVTQNGLASPGQVKWAMTLSFGAAALMGLYLVAVGGWPIAVLGMFCIAAGIAYTGGPWPLGYHGLGDLCVFLFFGPVAVMGSAYLQTGKWSLLSLAAALPVGFTVTALLVVNNLRDIETDRCVGKRTLAVLIGARLTRLQYAALLLGPYLLVSLFAFRDFFPRACWLTWLTLPWALRLVGTVGRGLEGPGLNLVLKRTAQLHFLFGLLLAAGLLLR